MTNIDKPFAGTRARQIESVDATTTLDSGRQKAIDKAAAVLSKTGASVVSEATRFWDPASQFESPLVELFKIPATFDVLDLFSGTRAAATAINDGELNVDDLAKMAAPLQEKLAKAGWSSWLHFRPVTSHGLNTSTQVDYDGAVSMRIAPANLQLKATSPTSRGASLASVPATQRLSVVQGEVS